MITIDMIDEFRKRTNSSYEDARLYLERHQGEMLDAIIDFEKSRSTGFSAEFKAHPNGKTDVAGTIAQILQKGFDICVVVEDKGVKLLNVPVLLLLLLLPLWPFLLLIALFFVFLGYRLGIRDMRNENIDMESLIGNIGTRLREQTKHGRAKYSATDPRNDVVKDKTGTQMTNPSGPAQTNGTKKEDGYKEYTIE